MLIKEVAGQIRTFTAVVRVDSNGASVNVTTQINAVGLSQARLLFQHLYGSKNLVSVVQHDT